MNQATSYTQILGHVIRGYRELQGISLDAMAAQMGFQTRSGWSRVESGDTTITASQLRRVARQLGRHTWTLVKDADAMAEKLSVAGVVVHDENPRDKAVWLLGGAAILALVTGAAVASATTTTTRNTNTRAGRGPKRSF